MSVVATSLGVSASNQQLLQDFKDEMALAPLMEKFPLDALSEHILSGVQQWH